jgi:hypothetical protein
MDLKEIACTEQDLNPGCNIQAFKDRVHSNRANLDTTLARR